MIQYNFAAELASFIIIIILLLNLYWEKEHDSMRNRFFKGIVLAIFLLVAFTLISTYMIMYKMRFPEGVIEFVLVLYYMSLPLALVMGMLYVKSLTRNRHSKEVISLSTILLLVPYAVYVIICIFNHWYSFLFKITHEYGYERQVLYQLPYPTVLFYVGAIFVIALKNRSETHKGIGFVLCANVIIMGSISFLQLFFPEILLSGLANVAGVLVVYLYVQNVTKSRDALTGLHNRNMLTYKLSKCIKQFSKKKVYNENREACRFSLIVYSLRNIKGINERYGLLQGDELLEEVGKYLRARFAPYTVYRYSGDEFAIFIERPPTNLDFLAEEVADRFNSSFLLNEKKQEVDVKVVYARVDFPDFGQGVRSLISALDYSISMLKHGKYRANYMHDITICDKMSRRNQVLACLKTAIENEGFEIYYQAIHSTKNNTFSGAEALLRLKSNEVVPIYPDEFIPLAEETGLIVNITYIVLEKVCADLHRIKNTLKEDIGLNSISINFPYAQFLEHDMVDKITALLEKYDVEPKQIKIEITERTLIDDAGLIRGIMQEMQDKGFVFEVDDFGVDYSNISTILNLPVDIIKIDRSLVSFATAAPRFEEFFRLLINAIKLTGRRIIVEGVEEKEHAVFFESCACEYIQGFYYAKPLPYDAFIEFLQKNKN